MPLDSPVIVDGLIVSDWSREVFEEMRDGGLTAANCTCAVWHNFRETMDNIAAWQGWFRDNGDILVQARSVADIRAAKEAGKVAIFLGWQNSYPIEDRVDYLPLFHDLGVRVIQLTYNTQNLVGSGCWESRDSGLSDFGRDVIDEMNRLGMLVDLSHVGDGTSRDAILHSKQPVAYTHCAPNALYDHPRNKPDEMLKLISDRGGFTGVVAYTPFMAQQGEATVDDVVALLDHTISVAGEENVGIGTDFTQGHGVGFFEYLRSDKGRGRALSAPMADRPPNPKGLDGMRDYPNLIAAMDRAGWTDARIERVAGENWLRFLGEVWRG